MKTKMKKKTFTVLLGISALAFVASTGVAVYSANAEGEVAQPVLTMQAGAAIRTFAPTGIRFVSEISKTDYETLTAKNAVFYTLIIPKKLVPEGGITADNYKTVDAERVQAKNSIVVGTDKVTFSGTLVGEQAEDGTYAEYFPETAYNMPLTAVSYYTYTENAVETVVFANNPQTYSIAYIASALLASSETDPYYAEITDSVLSGGISFGSESYELYVGDTLNTTLNAEGLKAVYTSDNKEVVTIDEAGKLTGVKSGTAQITAKIGNKTAIVNVTVKNPIELNGTYDFSLEGENSTTSVELDGNVTKIISGAVEVIEGVSYADGKLTFTKTALQALLGGKAYAEGLAIEIYTSADKKYTATVNIATMFIDSAGDLTAITNANQNTNYVDAYYIVTADIDASTAGIEMSGSVAGNSWSAKAVSFVNVNAALSGSGFKGIFDGRGHVISNLNTFSYKWQGMGGLFGQLLDGSVVKNVAFTDVTVGGRFGCVLVGYDSQFKGAMENVVISVKESLANDGDVAARRAKILWELSGGSIFNCLFTNVDEVSVRGEVESMDQLRVMSVTPNATDVVKNNGGINALGTKYNAQPNYARVNEMLAALQADNKLQNWGDITYANGAVYYGGNVVVLPELVVESSINGNEVSCGETVTFTTDGYVALSLKEEVVGVTLENGTLTIGKAEEGTQIVIVATSTLNASVTKELFTYTVIRNYTETALTGTYDLSLENATSSVTPSQAIEGSIEKVKAEYIDVTEGVSFADGQMTFTKAALQALLGGKAYTEELAIEIYTSADKKYTATVNIATMLIDSADDLTKITNANTAANIDAYYIVTADIDASEAGITVNCTGNGQTYNNVVRFVNNDTQSSATAGFAGIFDGRGHVISNINSYAYVYNGLGGLFGQLLSGSQVKNVAFTNVTAVGRYGTILVGESQKFYGTLENVVITVKEIHLQGNGAHTCAYIVADLSGGTFKNCLFIGVGTNSTSGSSGGATNVMTVASVRQDTGGFSWTGNAAYNAQPVYASVDAMLTALATNNKLQNWGDITYNAEDNAIYFGRTEVVVAPTTTE